MDRGMVCSRIPRAHGRNIRGVAVERAGRTCEWNDIAVSGMTLPCAPAGGQSSAPSGVRQAACANGSANSAAIA
eukprot:2996831-Prymnesium_polylepis.1